MDNNVTIYKGRKTKIGGGLFILIALSLVFILPRIIEGTPIETNKILGLAGFWLIGIVLALAPRAFKLEVGNTYIKTYFLNFCLRDLHTADVEVLEYGNLFLGGMNGKGLKGWEKTKRGNLKFFSIGEIGYGKEAITHAYKVLSSGKILNTKI